MRSPLLNQGSADHSAIVELNSVADESMDFSRKGQRQRRKCRYSFGVVCCAVVGVLFAVLLMLGVWVIGPAVAQASIDHSTLSLLTCAMHDPDTVSISLDCRVRLDNAGIIAADMEGFRVSVMRTDSSTDANDDANTFGFMMMPSTSVVASGPTFIRLQTRLNITNSRQFTLATAGVLQGEVGSWKVLGQTHVNAHIGNLRFRWPVQVEKEMLLPPTLLSKVEAFNLEIVGSTPTSIVAKADTSLLSVSVLELHKLGRMSFALHAERGGGYVGKVTIKNFDVRRGANLFSSVEAVLQVDPEAKPGSEAHAQSLVAVRQFLKNFAAGNDTKAELRGPTACDDGSPFLLNLVRQNVTIKSSGAFATNLATAGIDIVRGEERELVCSATATFQSGCRVRSGGLGSLKFSFIDAKNRVIGAVQMSDTFGVVPGINTAAANPVLIRDGTSRTDEGIADFVGTFVGGTAQSAYLYGPVDHPIEFLNGAMKIPVTVAGNDNSNLLVNAVLTQDSVGGFPLPDGKVMRGAVGIAANPFSADITMTNVLFDLYVQQPLKYTFSSGLWTSGKDVSCPSSTYFARTGTRPGMHLYPMLCPNKKCDQRLSQLATVTLPAKSEASFFSPAWPIPAQQAMSPGKCPGIIKPFMPGFGCCFDSLFFASACRQLHESKAHLMTSCNGSMTINVGNFSVDNVHYRQNDLSFNYEMALIDGFVMGGLLKCDDFKDF